jgi:hypothetical protein
MEKSFCVCQMGTVLYYFLRTESREGANPGEISRPLREITSNLAHAKWGETLRDTAFCDKSKRWLRIVRYSIVVERRSTEELAKTRYISDFCFPMP